MMLQNVEPTANGRGHGGYIHPYTVDYIIVGTSRFWNPVTEICSCLVTSLSCGPAYLKGVSCGCGQAQVTAEWENHSEKTFLLLFFFQVKHKVKL